MCHGSMVIHKLSSCHPWVCAYRDGVDTRPVTHQSLGLLLHLASVGRRSADAATDSGALRQRHLVALTLIRDHSPISQQDLAEGLHLDPSNVVGVLNELEERALVTRRRDPVDRRRHIVEISADGYAELAAMERRLACVEDELLKALTAEQRTTLHELLLRAAGGQVPSCSGEAGPGPC
jgi:DNA-binding MarR family transcriptional regulator